MLIIRKDDPEYGNFYQGDILLTEQQRKAKSSRTGLIDTQFRWPNKTIIYQMSTNHTKEQQLYIKLAHWAIESVSCIKFKQRTNESAHIFYQV